MTRYLVAAAVVIGLVVTLAMVTGNSLRDDFSIGRLITLTVLLILLGPALFAGNLSRNLRHLAAWGAVLCGLVLLYGIWEGTPGGIDGLRGSLAPEHDSAAADGVARFHANRDGHFVAQGRVNGEPITFMIDTGATAIALAPHHAEALGFHLDDLSYTVPVNTANGLAYAAVVRLDQVDLGGVSLRNISAFVNQEPMDESLLGMNFLNQLSGYDVRNKVITLYQ